MAIQLIIHWWFCVLDHAKIIRMFNKIGNSWSLGLSWCLGIILQYLMARPCPHLSCKSIQHFCQQCLFFQNTDITPSKLPWTKLPCSHYCVLKDSNKQCTKEGYPFSNWAIRTGECWAYVLMQFHHENPQVHYWLTNQKSLIPQLNNIAYNSKYVCIYIYIT